MLFYRGADIPGAAHSFQGCVQPPRPPNTFTLFSLCNWHILQFTLYRMPFNCSFVSRSLGYLKTWPSVLSGFKAVLVFSRFKIRLIRSDTPLKYGTVIIPAKPEANNSWVDPDSTDYCYFLCTCRAQRNPNQIKWVKYMWSTPSHSESVWNSWCNSDRFSHSLGLA